MIRGLEARKGLPDNEHTEKTELDFDKKENFISKKSKVSEASS